MSPFLSVVTISFNQGRFLPEAIESVLSQKAADVEYVVVDPGSTDGSRDILERYRPQIDHLILEPDSGPADGLNKGFARATGRYGYFINADDFLLPGAVGKLRRLWQDFPDLDVLFCSAWKVDSAGRPLRQMMPTKVSRTTLREGSAVTVQQGMSFRLETFRSVGGFNAGNRTCWDAELIIDMVRGGARTKVLSDRIGAFRIHESSISGRSDDSLFQRYRSDYETVLAKIRPELRGVHRYSTLITAPVFKYCRNPGLFYYRLRDIMFPRAMQRRWLSDVGVAQRGVSDHAARNCRIQDQS